MHTHQERSFEMRRLGKEGGKVWHHAVCLALVKSSLKIVYIEVCVQMGDGWTRKHQWLIEQTTKQREEEFESLYGMHMHSASMLIRIGPTVLHITVFGL